MRYMVRKNGDDTYIAYVDESDSQSTLSGLIRKSIFISLGVIMVMFILSLILSKRVLKPVEKAWDDQKRFVADASHELKTPLAVIMSNIDMVVKSEDKNSEKNRGRLDNIKTESERMKELVSELLEIARGDVGEKELIKEDVNLSELYEDELLVWDPTFYEEGKTLETEIEEDIHVIGDITKLRRLLVILVDNALKYSKENSTIKVSLKKEYTKKDRSGVTLRVSNKGVALSEEECTKIFERFYRADKSREIVSGYGLGLSIAVATAEEHSATITAESDGIDTNTFVVRF